MNKIAILLTAFVVASAATIKLADMPFETPQRWLEQDQEVRELVLRYQSFKDVFEQTLTDLGDRRIDLQTAQRRVVAASRRHWPPHVDYLSYAEPGVSSEERVARNLVEHLRGEQKYEPRLEPRVQELEIELAEMLNENNHR